MRRCVELAPRCRKVAEAVALTVSAYKTGRLPWSTCQLRSCWCPLNASFTALAGALPARAFSLEQYQNVVDTDLR
jgi:hypothetical protein